MKCITSLEDVGCVDEILVFGPFIPILKRLNFFINVQCFPESISCLLRKP